MARTRIEYGVELVLTPEEEAARDVEEQEWADAQPMNDWLENMATTDHGMPRYAEDILDSIADKSGVAQITLDKLQAKKDLRATKP